MGLFVPSKRPQHRKFDYQPRFYNPEREQKIRERIRIQSHAASRRRSPIGLVYAIILFIFAVFLYTSLS
ncbi:MAG: hypothetical protein R2834_15665 [Rhodothermales bacterium]